MNTTYATFVAGCAALGGFLFGFDSAVINGAVPGIQSALRSSWPALALPWPSSCWAAWQVPSSPARWPTASAGARSWH
jgi:hypothetical protein